MAQSAALATVEAAAIGSNPPESRTGSKAKRKNLVFTLKNPNTATIMSNLVAGQVFAWLRVMRRQRGKQGRQALEGGHVTTVIGAQEPSLSVLSRTLVRAPPVRR